MRERGRHPQRLRLLATARSGAGLPQAPWTTSRLWQPTQHAGPFASCGSRDLLGVDKTLAWLARKPDHH